MSCIRVYAHLCMLGSMNVWLWDCTSSRWWRWWWQRSTITHDENDDQLVYRPKDLYIRKRWTFGISDEPSTWGSDAPIQPVEPAACLDLASQRRTPKHYALRSIATSSSTRKHYSLLATLATHNATAPLKLAIALPDAGELLGRVPPSTAHVIAPISALARPVTLPPKGPQGGSRRVELAVVGRLVEED